MELGSPIVLVRGLGLRKIQTIPCHQHTLQQQRAPTKDVDGPLWVQCTILVRLGLLGSCIHDIDLFASALLSDLPNRLTRRVTGSSRDGVTKLWNVLRECFREGRASNMRGPVH